MFPIGNLTPENMTNALNKTFKQNFEVDCYGCDEKNTFLCKGLVCYEFVWGFCPKVICPGGYSTVNVCPGSSEPDLFESVLPTCKTHRVYALNKHGEASLHFSSQADAPGEPQLFSVFH